jgi:hypothetical protein
MLILQAQEKKGQTWLGVVYSDGKMLPPPSQNPKPASTDPCGVGFGLGSAARAWGHSCACACVRRSKRARDSACELKTPSMSVMAC